jgi:hypothetical protein
MRKKPWMMLGRPQHSPRITKIHQVVKHLATVRVDRTVELGKAACGSKSDVVRRWNRQQEGRAARAIGFQRRKLTATRGLVTVRENRPRANLALAASFPLWPMSQNCNAMSRRYPGCHHFAENTNIYQQIRRPTASPFAGVTVENDIKCYHRTSAGIPSFAIILRGEPQHLSTSETRRPCGLSPWRLRK